MVFRQLSVRCEPPKSEKVPQCHFKMADRILKDPMSKPPVLILVPIGPLFYDSKISKNAEFLLDDTAMTVEDIIMNAKLCWKLPSDAAIQFCSSIDLVDDGNEDSSQEVTPPEVRLKRNKSPRIVNFAKHLSDVLKFEPSMVDPNGEYTPRIPGQYSNQGDYTTGIRDLRWTVI